MGFLADTGCEQRSLRDKATLHGLMGQPALAAEAALHFQFPENIGKIFFFNRLASGSMSKWAIVTGTNPNPFT